MTINQSSFDNFVEQKTEETKLINWEAKKKLWLTKVNKLYSQIEVWLSDWTRNKKIKISTDETRSIVEEYIGQYQTPIMKISIGDEKIELIPIGTLIIGSQGRIDVKGRAGSIMLILIKKDTYPDVNIKVFNSERKAKEDKEKKPSSISESNSNQLIWKYAKRSPQLEYFELNKTLFEEILMAVSGN